MQRNEPDDATMAKCDPVDAAAFASPMFDAVRRHIALLPENPGPAALNALAVRETPVIRTGGGMPIRFVAPAPGAAGAIEPHYEERVYREGAIETRPGNWHDTFNALAWLSWPRTKAALNVLHLLEMTAAAERLERPAECRVPQPDTRRGAARDMATLFDENGIVFACADSALEQLIRGFCWTEAFSERRDRCQANLRCFVFGHALLDKARAPYKGMTGHALIFPVSREFLQRPISLQVDVLDACAAAWFADRSNLDSPRRFAPVPLLGLPGNCDDNADPAYYDDIIVFRPGRGQSVQ